MIQILGGAILLAIIFGPQLWVYYVIKKHSRESPSVPGTGAELVNYLAGKSNLTNLRVERTSEGNHYCPVNNVVRLSEEAYDKKTLTAVAIAAHELGHAIQKAEGSRLMETRDKFIKLMNLLRLLSVGALFAGPILFLLLKIPIIGLITTMIYIGVAIGQVLLHLITLPIEFDASFNKALPMLEQMNRFDQQEMVAIRQVLRAAALTYIAGALMSIINILFRRGIRR